jgi:hypothetical protein
VIIISLIRYINLSCILIARGHREEDYDDESDSGSDLDSFIDDGSLESESEDLYRRDPIVDKMRKIPLKNHGRAKIPVSSSSSSSSEESDNKLN